MKQLRVVLPVLFLSIATGLLADTPSTATPYFSMRSQSANLPLEMVGQERYIEYYKAGENYSVLSVTPGFQQSFRSKDIACCLFGSDLVQGKDCAQITISGSSVANRGSKDWLADYFGLPTDFKSSISFNPKIRNIIVDTNFYMGLDNWKEGMYFKMHMPYVNTRWELDYCEKVSVKGTTNYPFGYFSGNLDQCPAGGGNQSFQDTSIFTLGNSRSGLLTSASDFLGNCKSATLDNYILYQAPNITRSANLVSQSTILYPLVSKEFITFEPLNYSRWAGCENSPLIKNGVADWRFTLGYNAYNSEKFHVGFGITGAAPVGNRPHGQFLFEPIIGNGNHWELGAELSSHYRFWQSENEERSLTA